MIRKASAADLDKVESIYDLIHRAEEEGKASTGWIRGTYPTRATAEAALERDDLFVLEENGAVLGAGIINHIQVDVYYSAPWQYETPDERVCVLHTLVVSPKAARRGLGRQFASFYEAWARDHGCTELRIDTNARNLPARNMYRSLGYREIDVVPTVFNGIGGVELVLLEKHL
ncbi:MAG: GNAT family N-acetyltransferase [Clostridia bacterium]|nr:GNAT family N-acetyltransferase [Clostridia bacterium]